MLRVGPIVSYSKNRGIFMIEEKRLLAIIGKRIRLFRNKAGLTQDQFAELMGYNSKSSMISQIERGKAGMSIAQAMKSAKILNVPAVALLSETKLTDTDINLLNDFMTLLSSGNRPNIEAIRILIKASTNKQEDRKGLEKNE